MLPTIRFRSKVMFAVIGVLIVLLVANIFLTLKTNREIAVNKAAHVRAEAIRLHMVEVIRMLHLLDLGLRGYALNPQPQLLTPFDSANRRQHRYLTKLGEDLKHQGFPIDRFEGFRDTVKQYFHVANTMKHYLEKGDMRSFDSVFRADPGFPLQRSYRVFLRQVNAFEDKIANEANRRYERGLKFNSWMQIMLFALGVPTLLYVGYYASQTFRLAEKLHASEKQKVEILENQNTLLEHRVQERTNELVALNEEITAQNEEIQTSNEQLLLQRDTLANQHELLNQQHKELQDAKRLIELQHGTISNHNKALVDEVENQTRYLIKANTELQGHNKRLEQFAFVVSHNLRGPMSRILGLAAIFDYSNSHDETKEIIKKLKHSAEELDQVIKDLTIMTVIRNVNRSNFRQVDLRALVGNVITTLRRPIKESFAEVRVNLPMATVFTLEEYLENVLLILIQNAIQYKSHQRLPVIEITSGENEEETWIEVRDNGIGIDLKQFATQMFVPYRRFNFETKGRGLGLYTAKTQMETLGGDIDVFSALNEGTRFRITFRKS